LAAVVLIKIMAWLDVIPAVAGEDGAVHGGVQLAQADDVGIMTGGVVEEVVGFGESQLPQSHD